MNSVTAARLLDLFDKAAKSEQKRIVLADSQVKALMRLARPIGSKAEFLGHLVIGNTIWGFKPSQTYAVELIWVGVVTNGDDADVPALWQVGLNVRALNALSAAGILNTLQLQLFCKGNPTALHNLKNVGKTTKEHIKEKTAQAGIPLDEQL